MKIRFCDIFPRSAYLFAPTTRFDNFGSCIFFLKLFCFGSRLPSGGFWKIYILNLTVSKRQKIGKKRDGETLIYENCRCGYCKILVFWFKFEKCQHFSSIQILDDFWRWFFCFFEKMTFLDCFDMYFVIFDIHNQYLVGISQWLVNQY